MTFPTRMVANVELPSNFNRTPSAVPVKKLRLVRGGLDAYGVAVAHQAFYLFWGGVIPVEDSAQVVGMGVVIALDGLGFRAGDGGDDEAAGAHFACSSLLMSRHRYIVELPY